MLCKEDLPAYIEREMPELSGHVNADGAKNVYDVVRHILKYTKSQVIRHNLVNAQKCMKLIEQLYFKGNNAIKNAVENVFVFSFTHAFFHDEEKMKEVMNVIPDALYKLYRKQLLSSHL